MQQTQPGGPRRHVSVRSQLTNASGVADSSISFDTVSQFPRPPTSVPASPMQPEFRTNSPSRSITSSRHTKRNFPELSTTAPLSPNRRDPGVSAPSSKPTSNRWFKGSRGKAHAARPSHPLVPPNNPLDPNLLARVARPDESSPGPSYRTLSPSDWHEGSSSIFVDPAEERLLSTSLITNLLSSAENSDDTRSWTHSASRFAASDAASTLSDMTYPPPHPHPLHSQPPEYHMYPPPTSPQTATPLLRNQPPSRRPPPSSFVADAQLEKIEESSVIRTATRGPSMQGASVVGIAPATLRAVSAHGSIHPSSRTSRASGGVSATTGRHSGTAGEARSDNNSHMLDISEYHVQASSGAYSPALPSTAGSHSRFPQSMSRERRQSMQSTKTTASYSPSFISRLTSASGHVVRQAFAWGRVKPLPPVPKLPNTPNTAEREHRKVEDSMPLPDLVSRAGQLSHMLEKGHYPHRSLRSYHLSDGETEDLKGRSLTLGGDMRSTGYGAPYERQTLWPYVEQGTLSGEQTRPPWFRRKKPMIILGIIALIILAVIGAVVGVVKSRKGNQLPSCPGNLTGLNCDLDATCVCTSSVQGQCNQLAQSIVALAPTLNTLFNTNYTTNSISTAIWLAQGAPTGKSCASQSLLIDVGPTLQSSQFPNRTLWAQTALLWNLVESQNISAVAKMKSFVAKAPWNDLAASDGPLSGSSAKFVITESGYIFDFAAQTASQVGVTFANASQATSAQIQEVGPTALSALNRMYTFALASSTQRNNSLALYWSTVLQQDPEDLPLFLATVESSPMLIPFDAMLSSGNQTLASLLTNSTTTPFPPPLACYPGLAANQLNQLNQVETTVFGLSPASSLADFDLSCFPNRPLYGVLDILQLRLPFIDSRTGVAKQAAVLERDVGPRVVVYSGEMLSALPGATDAPTIGPAQLDARQYGTLSYMNHVFLNYFNSIVDINLAKAVVNFVLSSPAVPPVNTSALYQSLALLPALEIAVFGNVEPSDISSTVSSFSSPSGSLFFGSDQAEDLRNWAIGGTGSSVAWTTLSTSPEVVRDSSFNNAGFNSIWNPAFAFLHAEGTPNVTVGVSNITNAFQAIGEFAP